MAYVNYYDLGMGLPPTMIETDSLGGDPVLRRLRDDEVVRPASASRNTVKALEERGLISSGKSRDPLTIAWHIKTKAKK